MPSRAIRTAEATRKIRIYYAVGVVLLIILLATLYTSGKQLTLRCDRLDTGAVDCVVRQSVLGLITLSEKTIAGAQAISMGQQCVDVDCNYRLEVYAIQGLVPVDEKYTSDFQRLTNIKNSLNEFFKDKTRSYVEMKVSTNPILLVGVVVAFLLVFAYLGYLIWQAQHPSQEE
jgi:hypothetical protein